VEVSKEDVVARANKGPDGLIEGDNSHSLGWNNSSELTGDEISIVLELSSAMGECMADCPSCEGPSHEPFSVSLDLFGRRSRSSSPKFNFVGAETFRVLIDGRDGVDWGKDRVEVDRPTPNNVVPFWVREFGNCGTAGDEALNGAKVSGKVGQGLLRFEEFGV
jgi:hypothetical protein